MFSINPVAQVEPWHEAWLVIKNPYASKKCGASVEYVTFSS